MHTSTFKRKNFHLLSANPEFYQGKYQQTSEQDNLPTQGAVLYN